MNKDYDFICLGTGLKESILAGVLALEKKEILFIDRNSYYGAESASLNLEQLFDKFSGEGKGKEIDVEKFGRTRDYSVDVCPKFLMASGNLVKVMVYTKVTRYLAFQQISGSYVARDGKCSRVPATASEARKSDMLSMMQMMRYGNFLRYVYNYEHSDSKTHKSMDLTKMTAKELFKYYNCDENTMAFTGHAIALYLNDDYLDQPALDMVERIKLYAFSLTRHEAGKSPYIYPDYGLGGISEGFSRLCAVNRGTFMLNKNIEEILFDDEGKVRGVRIVHDPTDKDLEPEAGTEARCTRVIADPSYFVGTDKVKKTGQVARCIAVLNAPFKNTNSETAQIIIPSKHAKGRTTDIYICVTGERTKNCPKGKYIAVMSCNNEGESIPSLEADKEACAKGVQRELKTALDLLDVKQVDKLFMWVTDILEPCNDPTKDGCFITSGYDATTHFETTSREVLSLYEKINGKPLDLTVDTSPDTLADPDQ